MARPETIEITDFVPADAIDFMFFDQPYYVAPGGEQPIGLPSPPSQILA